MKIKIKKISRVSWLVALILVFLAQNSVKAIPIGNDVEYIPYPRNLGVGDDTPDKKLVVNGDASIIGQIQITGGSPVAGYVLTTDATGLATWQAVTVSNSTTNNTISQNGQLINGTVFRTDVTNSTITNSTINGSTIINTTFTGGVVNGTTLISQNDLKVTDDGSFGDTVTARAFIAQVFNGGVFRGDGSGLTGISTTTFNNSTFNNTTSQNGRLINGDVIQSNITNSTINNSIFTNSSFTGGIVNGTTLISQDDLKVSDDGSFGDTVTARAFIAQVFNGGVFRGDGSGLTGISTTTFNNSTFNNTTSQNGRLINGDVIQSNITNSTINNSIFTNSSFTGGIVNGTTLISQDDLKVSDDGSFGDTVTARAFIAQVFNGGVFRGDGSGLTGISTTTFNNSTFNNTTSQNGRLINGDVIQSNITNSTINNSTFTGGTINGATLTNTTFTNPNISKLVAPDGSPNPALSVDNNGHVGIGGTNSIFDAQLSVNGTNAGNTFVVLNHQLNSSGAKFGVSTKSTIGRTINGTSYIRGMNVNTASDFISSGITDTGYRIGYWGDILRSNTSDNGTLGEIDGFVAVYGHWLDTGNNATTQNAYGIKLVPAIGNGTITNSYGVFLTPAVTGGAVSNYYGIYQQDANAKNYFNGNLGIGIVNPTTKLDVNGTVKANSIQLASGGTINGATLTNTTFSNPSISKLVAPDGSPNPALSVDNNGFIAVGNGGSANSKQVFIVGFNNGSTVSDPVQINGIRINNSSTANNSQSQLAFSSSVVGGAVAGIVGRTVGSDMMALDFYTEKGGLGRTVDLTINSPTGYVGIGTPNPQAKLDVNGTLLAKNIRLASGGTINGATLTNTTFTNPQISQLVSPDGSPSPALSVDNNGGLQIRAGLGSVIRNVNSVTGMDPADGFRINFENGPVTGLSVNPNNDYLIFDKTDGNDLNPDGGIAFFNTGSDGIREPSIVINGAGNVGIGKIPSAVKLDVNGTLLAKNIRLAAGGTINGATLTNTTFTNPSISKLVAPDGSPNPALSVDNNGNIAIASDAKVRIASGSNIDFLPSFQGSAIGSNTWLDGTVGTWYSHVGHNNRHAGFGTVHGVNLESPIVWMYLSNGQRNAFDVRSVGFNVAPQNGTSLFTVRESGKVGIKTNDPKADLHIVGDHMYLAAAGAAGANGTIVYPSVGNVGLTFMNNFRGNNNGYGWNHSAIGTNLCWNGATLTYARCHAFGVGNSVQGIIFSSTDWQDNAEKNRIAFLIGHKTATPNEVMSLSSSGTVKLGVEDSGLNSALIASGAGTGSDEGGEIQLEFAADYDTNGNAFVIDTYRENLRIFPSSISHPSQMIGINSRTGNVVIGNHNYGNSEKLEVVGNVKATKFIGDGSGLTGLSNSLGVSKLVAPDGSPDPALSVDNGGNIAIAADAKVKIASGSNIDFIPSFQGSAIGSNTWLDGTVGTWYSHVGHSNRHAGFGTVDGANLESPVIWMYKSNGTRNALDVRKVGFNVAPQNGDSLLTVRESGKVGIGISDPKANLHIMGSHMYLASTGGLGANGTIAYPAVGNIGLTFMNNLVGNNSGYGWNHSAIGVNLCWDGATHTYNRCQAFGVGSSVQGIIFSATDYQDTVNHRNRMAFIMGHETATPTEVMTLDASGKLGIGVTNPVRSLHLSQAMRIEPSAAPPAAPSLGDIYVDSSEAVCVYVNGAWSKIAGAGSCI